MNMPDPIGEDLFDAEEMQWADDLQNNPEKLITPEGFEPEPARQGATKGSPPAEDTGSENEGESGDQDSEEQKQSTTADGDDKAKSESEEDKKGALPEHLKPFEDLVTAKDWDASKPEEFISKVLTGYQEMEQHSGNRGREVTLLNTRNQEVSDLLKGDIEQINEHRKNAGAPPLPVDNKSLDDKIKANDDLISAINTAFRGFDAEGKQTEDGKAAWDWLNQHLTTTRDDLKFDQRYASQNPANKEESQNRLKAAANQNAANIRSQNPGVDLNKTMNVIFQDPVLDPLFASFGLGPVEIMSTPERSHAAFQLALLVEKAKNFDDAVKTGVDKRMGQKRKNANAGTPGGSAQSAGTKVKDDNTAGQGGLTYPSHEEVEALSNY